MNTWRNGAYVEELYCRKLLNEGYTVRRFPKAKYTSRLRFTSQDLWGTDIVAKRGRETLWIQVKSGSNRMPPVLTETLNELQTLCENTSEYEKVMWVGYDASKQLWKELVVSYENGEVKTCLL